MDQAIDIWANPFGIEDQGQFAPPINHYMAPDSTPSVAVELEPQPHGGSLKRATKEEPGPSFASDLSKAQLLAFPAPQSVTPWPPSLVFDLALGIDSTPDVLDRYNVSTLEYEALLSNPVFRKELTDTMRKNQAEGVTFARRTASIAEDCLPDMYAIIKDPTQPASTRVDTWKYMTKVGRLEPTNAEKGAGSGGTPMVNIQINL